MDGPRPEGEHEIVFARCTFLIAGVYGLLAMLPTYFLEGRIGRDAPPPITHPEFFDGFVDVAVAWQFAFLVIARDPVRFRALMPPAVLEKASFGLPAVALWLEGRLAGPMLIAGLIDLILGVLFDVAYLRTPQRPPAPY